MNEIRLWVLILALILFFVEGHPLAQEADYVFIYQHPNFGGAYMRLDRDQAIPNLGILETGAQGSTNWNDQISSVKVGANKKIIVYEHINFGGASRTLYGLSCSFSGSYPTMPSGWNDKASSLKIMQNDQPPTGPAPSMSQMAIYENANYCGAYIIFGSTEQPDLKVLKIGAPGAPHWNDRISSIRVGSNMKLIAFQDPNYKGSSVTLSGPADIMDLSGSGWNDTISSFKVVPKQ
jgi:hypothetical protein